ncbi:uncharacterized protein C2orf50-like [Corticium candelabrum]|uniref:uncharacterized protein C2orf50-like n=1 Tax=Corticium candelabrum TaxID=121492 RepID=UPI002E266990|nr:uncharacterized protein C2orf50-like [Corticium candelabrum]
MAVPPKYGARAYRSCDVVRQDSIWKTYVRREAKSARKWRDNWAFITQYDLRGELKTPQKKPENLTVFGDKIPPTSSQQIGARLKSPFQIAVRQLESSMAKRCQRSDLNTKFVFT